MFQVTNLDYYDLEDVEFISPINSALQRVGIVASDTIKDIADNVLNTTDWFESDFYSAVSSVIFFPLKLDEVLYDNLSPGTPHPLFDNIVINKTHGSGHGFYYTGFTQILELCRFSKPAKYNNFLDLEDYTKVILHLPFVDDIIIPQSKLNTQIIVKFSLGLGDGSITYYIGTNEYTLDEEPTELFYPIITKRGMCGIKIPIGSSNYHQVNQSNNAIILNSLFGLIGATSELSTKQIFGIGGNVITHGLTSDLHRIARSGAPIQTLSDIYQLLQPSLEVQRPIARSLDSNANFYYRVNGYPSNTHIPVSFFMNTSNTYYKYVFKDVVLNSEGMTNYGFTETEYREFMSLITSKNGVYIK